ncbi:hypothetical protein GJ496_003934 [Pomphorhynchus laevis]|nr:hypothetical protein GJ496_003934 [Pomphorhynchus laevis]
MAPTQNLPDRCCAFFCFYSKLHNVTSRMTEDNDQLGLKKTLGMWHGVSVIFGSVVGSGIFISSNQVLVNCGSVGMTLIIWALCGVLVGCGALQYVELGCSMPKAGGDYEYLLSSLGSTFAFAFSFTRLVIIVPSTLAVAGISFGTMAITFFAYVNCRSTKIVNHIQLAFGLGKALALVTVVIAGLYALVKGKTDNFKQPFEGTSSNVASVINGFYGCIFTFSGWNYLNYVIEELKEPQKNLPRAAIIAISFIAGLYIFVNVGYFALLSKEEILTSNAIAVDAMQVLWKPLGIIVSLCVSMSVFGFINSMLFTTSRVVFSAARNHHMPVVLSYLHCNHNTPIASILLVTAISLIFMSLGTLDLLIYMVAFCESLFLVFTFIGYMYLRKYKPTLSRPFKVRHVFIFTCILSSCITSSKHTVPIHKHFCYINDILFKRLKLK